MSKTAVEHVADMTRELDARLSSGNVPDAEIMNIARDILRRKRVEVRPEIVDHPPEGKLMMDAFGNKAMVLPDGTIKEMGNVGNAKPAGKPAAKSKV